MELTVNVGSQGIALADGVDVQARAGRTGDLIVSELHGRYFEQLRAGRIWTAANQAAQAVSVALATTYTGILLFNPLNSGKLVVLNKTKFAQSAAPSTFGMIGLLAGYSATGGVTAQTTKLTPQNGQIGNGALPAAVALSAATITTPIYLAQLQDATPTGTLPTGSPLLTDIEGLIGLLPGAFVGISALTVVTGYGFMAWEEVDLPL